MRSLLNSVLRNFGDASEISESFWVKQSRVVLPRRLMLLLQRAFLSIAPRVLILARILRR
jgi:hypothetical protein